MAQLVEQLIRNQQVAGSSPASSSKKERHLLAAGVFLFWVPPPKGRLHPPVIEMLGRSEFALRRGFAWGKTLVRRKCAAGQKAGLPVLPLLSQSLKISILPVPLFVFRSSGRPCFPDPDGNGILKTKVAVPFFPGEIRRR